MRDRDEVPGPLFQPVPALAVMTILGVNQQMENSLFIFPSLCVSVFQIINLFSKSEKISKHRDKSKLLLMKKMPKLHFKTKAITDSRLHSGAGRCLIRFSVISYNVQGSQALE